MSGKDFDAHRKGIERIERKTVNERKRLKESIEILDECLTAYESGEIGSVMLDFWLKHDTWSLEEGLLLLVGFDPNRSKLGIDMDTEYSIYDLVPHLFYERGDGSALVRGKLDIDFPPGLSQLEVDFEAQHNSPEEFGEEYDPIGLTPIHNNNQVRLEDIFAKHTRMKSIFESGGHPSRSSPEFYIEWAERKGFQIPWIKWARSEGLIQDCDDATPVANQRAEGGEHVSRKLSVLNQAADRFWSHADPKDRDTHPTNAQIAAWLEERGFTQTLAKKAASIIRPEWAPAGRKPDQ